MIAPSFGGVGTNGVQSENPDSVQGLSNGELVLGRDLFLSWVVKVN
jgi:hypothetical protein